MTISKQVPAIIESDQTVKETSELKLKISSPPVNSKVETPKENNMFTLAVALILLVLLPIVCIDLINHGVDHTEMQKMGIHIK